MGKDLTAAGPAAEIAEIVYHGEKMILPEGMSLDAAEKLLQSRRKYLETQVRISESFNAFPWDGANALNAVLTKKFGWAAGETVRNWWGDSPPRLITIAAGYGKYIDVPWGSFSIPGVSGSVQTGVARKGRRFVFDLTADVLRKDEATIRSVFTAVREHLAQNSLYRGKAIKIRFLDDDGNELQMPEPSFLETGKLLPEHLIFTDDVQEMIATNLFTPISQVMDCINNGVPVKRGVLLGGVFGTGKTLAATVAASLAEMAGLTYVYVPRADELDRAIDFARQYQSPACVVFCEDIDRVVDGERTIAMDDLLNIIDGVDTKDANIIVVLTTNELERINPAMLRPGRLDAVIEVTPPDARACERLLRLYGGAAIDPNTVLTEVGEKLAGAIPSIVKEVVHRAKLAQIRLQPGQKVQSLSAEALLIAAKTMSAQQALLKRAMEPKQPVPTLDDGIERIVSSVMQKMREPAESDD